MTDIVDRLRGRYAMGPHLPNGKPEFGYRQFESTPLQHQAADYIEKLREALAETDCSALYDRILFDSTEKDRTIAELEAKIVRIQEQAAKEAERWHHGKDAAKAIRARKFF